MSNKFEGSDTKRHGGKSGLKKNFFSSSLSNLVEKRLSLKKKKSPALSTVPNNSLVSTQSVESIVVLDQFQDYKAKIIAEYELEKSKTLERLPTSNNNSAVSFHESKPNGVVHHDVHKAPPIKTPPAPDSVLPAIAATPTLPVVQVNGVQDKEHHSTNNTTNLTPTPDPPNIEITSVTPPTPRNRSASMIWVDLLTEEDVPNFADEITPETKIEETDSEAEGDQFDPNSELALIQSLEKRKLWFNKIGENDVDVNDGLSEEDEARIKSMYKKLRKESVAVSIQSARTPEPSSENSPSRYVDNLIFDMFMINDESGEEVVLIGTFLAALERTGLGRSDPRLSELFESLRQIKRAQELKFPKKASSLETLKLDRETFKSVITENIVLISKAFRQQFVIPEFQSFCLHIEEMFNKCKGLKSGKVADYIPQMASVNPNFWGVALCTVDGQRYSIGDTKNPFTIQCCSKPLIYAMALNELGEEKVHQYVGQEPSGRTFNELVLDYNKKPHNPMVNAGAIIIAAQLKQLVKPEMSLAEKFDYTYHYFKKLAGGEYIGFNNAVFLSEREAADRNYALGFYMRENKCFPEGTSLEECMDYYFQICSMECNCESLSIMAATLANGGICPISGEKILNPDSVRDVLALMHSCGMYDYSGQFAFKVGLPCKSSASGAIMLIVPNVLGMAIWSPPIDVLGNSVRGVALCQELVQVFNFHKYDNLKHASHKLDPRKHRYETKGLNIVNLLFSAASGDVTSMRRHHLSGMDMNASDYDGRTALHLAAAEGHLECVDYLLRQCYVKHNPVDRWGHLPLHDAIKFGHSDVATFLRNWANDANNALSNIDTSAAIPDIC